MTPCLPHSREQGTFIAIVGDKTIIGHDSVIRWLTQGVPPYTVVPPEKPSLRIKGMETHYLVPNYEI